MMRPVLRFRIAWERARRLEFWPPFLFYLPLVPFWIYWSIRCRGFGTITAANPSIPEGGFVGESKSQILSQSRSARVLPFVVIQPGTAGAEAHRLILKKLNYPCILKPDAGQKGFGVVLARSKSDVERYLKGARAPFMAQKYHQGPNEAGIFYVRIPGEPNGRIFSITHKIFPTVTGDGHKTLEGLILEHPRYRLQAHVFLTRHQRDLHHVVPKGRTLILSSAGNHAQGALFKDGSHLWSEALEASIDKTAKSFQHFYFGRFDVRYTTPEALRKGTGYGIVELNGATSESTNIYDPDAGPLFVYKTLVRQWRLLFQIGAANKQMGHATTPLWKLVLLWLDFVKNTETKEVAGSGFALDSIRQ
ncbi:MAG: carboxylate--amine ligase [Spirochaetia bacterium]|nr:carboxylate--amine ligase [Spirochaetia bacterium]